MENECLPMAAMGTFLQGQLTLEPSEVGASVADTAQCTSGSQPHPPPSCSQRHSCPLVSHRLASGEPSLGQRGQGCSYLNVPKRPVWNRRPLAPLLGVNRLRWRVLTEIGGRDQDPSFTK